MPLYEFQCSCGRELMDFFSVADLPKEIACVCGQFAPRKFSRPVVHIPAWMSDDGINRTARMREYRKEHLQHRDDLAGDTGSDPEPVKEMAAGTTSPDDFVRDLAAVGSVDGGARLTHDRFGPSASKDYVSLVTGAPEV